MIPQPASAPAAKTPRGQCAPRTRPNRRLSPAEAAFASFLADPRLTPFDKLILTLLAAYCLAPGNCFAFPSSGELARQAGADQVEDGGEARVNRSLAKAERLGILERIAWYEMDDWMSDVGRPKLGVSDPRERSRSARRFLLLWWKVPGLVDDFGFALLREARPGAGDRVDRIQPGASVRPDPSPAPGTYQAPAPAFRTGSKLEPSKSLNREEKFAGEPIPRRRSEDDEPQAERPRIPARPIAAAPAPAEPGPRPAELPRVPARPIAAAPAPPDPGPPPVDPAGLTPGQLAALAALTPEQRAGFERCRPGKRAEFLAPHARAFDPALLAFAVKDLPAPIAPVIPDASTPTPELIRYLAGHMGPSLAAQCARSIMVELDDRGGTKSYEVIYKLCGDVVRGLLDPEALSGPLSATLDRIRSGEPISNAAGYWMRSVKNWCRENAQQVTWSGAEEA